MDYFKTLPAQSRKYLLQLAEGVQGVVPVDKRTFRISTNQLDPEVLPETLLDQVSKWILKNHPYLYYYQVLNSPDLSAIERTFKEAKANNKDSRAYPRFNQQSEFLYVGCSSGMLKRFKDHLGYSAKSTYALQLSHWAQELTLKIDFVYARYPQDTLVDVLQAIEDTLWDTLLPMFGRKGKR